MEVILKNTNPCGLVTTGIFYVYSKLFCSPIAAHLLKLEKGLQFS